MLRYFMSAPILEPSETPPAISVAVEGGLLMSAATVRAPDDRP
jgi:hypothetical protein